jgi:peptidoglycan-associated lipoprotein
MQLKQLIRVLVVSFGVLALGACASGVRDGDNPEVSDANGGAMASGVNQGSGFDEDGGPAGEGLSKRTYYFDFDKSDVHDADKPAIFANADYLVAHTSAKVIVEGHTDPRGSREYNVALGERRANAVADLLKSKGVKLGQVRVVSYGAQRLAVPGHTEDDYQLDRRAIIVYTQK